MRNHILYSFRRCPYAIRARWALKLCSIKVELREVNLKNKPKDLLDKSKSKTIPLLILKNGTIIEESLDIILWSISNSKKFNSELYFSDNYKKEILNIIRENDYQFKFHLDRFKYSSRFHQNMEKYHFLEARKIIIKWNNILSKKSKGRNWLVGEEESIADWSLWPFLRQFKIACKNKKITHYLEPEIKAWLSYFEDNTTFDEVMFKYSLWNESHKIKYFPNN